MEKIFLISLLSPNWRRNLTQHIESLLDTEIPDSANNPPLHLDALDDTAWVQLLTFGFKLGLDQ